MRRVLSSFLVALATASTGGGLLHAAAQTPVASPMAPGFQAEDLILQVAEGNGYMYILDPSGEPFIGQFTFMDDGVVAGNIPPDVREWLVEEQVVDMHAMYFPLLPVNPVIGPWADMGIVIENRVTILQDADAAEELVDEYYEFLLEDAEKSPEYPSVTGEITDLPEHDEAIMGATGTDPFFHPVTGELEDFRVPYTRFIAQVGDRVGSVKVTSLDPAFNDAVARELLPAQLDCLTRDTSCEPVPLPANVPYEAQDPPSGTPVSRLPGPRRLTLAA